MPDPAQHNYIKKLLAMQDRGEIPDAGLACVDIEHDGWCAIFAGGYCNCDPAVILRQWPYRPGLEPSDN